MELEERIITHIQTFFGNNPRIDIHTHTLQQDDEGQFIPAQHKIFSLQDNKEEKEGEGREIFKDTIIGIQPIKETREALQPFSLSYALSPENAERLRAHIEKNFSSCQVNTIYKEKYCSIIVQGPINELQACTKRFKQLYLAGMNQGSINESIRQQIHTPHARLETLEHTKNQHTTMSTRPTTLEEFQALKVYAFDDEFMFWWDTNKKITSLQSSREDIITFLETHKNNFSKPLPSTIDLKNSPRVKLYSWLEEYFISQVGNRELNLHKRPLTHQLATQKFNPKTQQLEDIVYYFKHLSGQSNIKEVELTTGPATIITKKFANAKDMILGKQEFFHNHPALILISQNGMGYDLLQEREFLENEKKHAPRGQKNKAPKLEFFGANARISASAGFFKKVTVNSLIHIDLAPYSQNYFPFTVNNKLETVISLIQGKKFSKTQNYQQQIEGIIDTIISKRSLNENEELYGCEDVTVLTKASAYAVPLVFLKERLFSCTAEDICCTSKKRLALNEYLRKKINHFKTSQLMTDNEGYDNFLSYKVFENELATLRKNKPHVFNTPNKAKKGTGEASMYYITPFSKLYASKLNLNGDIREIYNYIKQLNIQSDEHSNSKTLARFDLMYTLEEGYLLPKVFEQSQNDFKNWKGKKENLIESYAHLFSRFAPINQSGFLYVFPQSISDSTAFQEAIKGMGCKVTQGNYISFGTGSFAIHDGVNIYKKEIDTTGTRGFKTLYEQELIAELIPHSFESIEETLFHMSNFCRQIQQGTLQREKMIYFIDAVARDYEEFSSYAQRQERVQQYVIEALKKGETFAKAKLARGWVNLETFLNIPTNKLFSEVNKNFFINQYIGPLGKRETRYFSKSKVGKIIAPSIYQFAKEKQIHIKKVTEKIILGQF